MNYAAITASLNALSRMALTSTLHEPQPVPAPVVWYKLLTSLQPPAMAFSRLPSPTLLHEQINLPITGSAFLPDLSSCSLFSDNSMPLNIRSLNSRNSDLSPIRMAPTSLSSLMTHFL